MERSAQVLGGYEQIAGIQTVAIVQEGLTHHLRQSPEPGQNLTSPRAFGIYIDYPGNRAAFDVKRYYGVELHEADRTFVMNGDELFTIVHETRTVDPWEPFNPLPNTTFLEWSSPQLILRRTIRNRATVRWLGEALVEARPADAVLFEWAPGQLYTLYFDRETGVLAKFELVRDDPMAGEADYEVFFDDYEPANGYLIPQKLRNYREGVPFSEMNTVEMTYNRPFDDSLLKPPADYGVAEKKPGDDWQVVPVGKDAWIVDTPGPAHNPLFVALDEYVVAFDSPLNVTISGRIIALIKETVPGKPIKYVVPSHHHDDHSGGLRAFVAEGATVVATSGNRAYFERLLSAHSRLDPNPVARDATKAEFLIVDDRIAFEDENHQVEIINIGPNPHVKDLYVAYLPEDRVLYTSDALQILYGHPLPPANKGAACALRRADELGLEYDTLLMSHAHISPKADVETSLAKEGAWQGPCA